MGSGCLPLDLKGFPDKIQVGLNHKSMPQTLFIFAHQDDEYFVAPRISLHVRDGLRPFCVYLTDGGAYGCDPLVRNQESRGYLRALGVFEKDIAFIGTDAGIHDGRLVYSLLTVYNVVISRVKGIPFHSLYCPAWEGGHPDHDAAHLIGIALSRHLNLQHESWQYPLYNGFKARGRFFSIMRPINTSGKFLIRKIEFLTALKTAFSCFRYRTQWRTWVGLFPQSLIRWVFSRKEILWQLDIQRVLERPHPGPLLYERWGRLEFQEFIEAAGDFYRTILKTRARYAE